MFDDIASNAACFFPFFWPAGEAKMVKRAMALRHDAFYGCAETALALENPACRLADDFIVGTIGKPNRSP